MEPQLSIGVANQVIYPKAGDVDDCACLACFMAALAVAPWVTIPGIPAFRAAAGNPDNKGEPDGHTIDECHKAIKAFWPELAKLCTVSKGELGKAAVLDLIEAGSVGMLFVWSGSLPPEHQYGFGKGHAIAAALKNGKLRIANPLAPAHSRWKEIGRTQLGAALQGFPGTGAQAILMPTVEAAFKTHPLYVESPASTFTQAQVDAIVAAATTPLEAKISAIRIALG